MKHVMIWAAMAAALIGTTALADDKDPEAYFKKMDTDSNGTVTKAEHDAFCEKKFDEADTNNDDALSMAEFKAHKEEKKEMKDKAE